MTSQTVAVDRFELEMLEHLAYVIEAFAEEAYSDARYEIGALQRRLEAAPDVDPAYSAMVAAALDRVQHWSQDRRDWPRAVAVTLSSLSRKLWARILPQAPG
jgi:Lon protease-like protein